MREPGHPGERGLPLRRRRARGPLGGLVWETRGVERQKEPAWTCAPITQPNTLSGLSSRRQGPEVSTGQSGVPSACLVLTVPKPSPAPACHHAGRPLAHRALLTEAGMAPGPVPSAVVPSLSAWGPYCISPGLSRGVCPHALAREGPAQKPELVANPETQIPAPANPRAASGACAPSPGGWASLGARLLYRKRAPSGPSL